MVAGCASAGMGGMGGTSPAGLAEEAAAGTPETPAPAPQAAAN